jgi:hypothetical protein
MIQNKKRLIQYFNSMLVRLRTASWLELFERWFSFGVKLIWLGLFILFGIYLRSEYKKDSYYLRDFKVPNSWVEQGYSGDVVKEMIVDEFDKIRQELYGSYTNYVNLRAGRGGDSNNAEFLTQISIEGFNLKAIVNGALTLLGKKNKSVGGYVTLSDSLQTMSVQITDQMTARVSINRNEKVEGLIRKATLQIMRVKRPLDLVNYYIVKRDTVSLYELEKFWQNNRKSIKDITFYHASVYFANHRKDYKKSIVWVDSLIAKEQDKGYPYYVKAQIRIRQAYLDQTIDAKKKEEYSKLYVEAMKNAIKFEEEEKEEDRSTYQYYMDLLGFYYGTQKPKEGIECLEAMKKIKPHDAMQNNMLAYMKMQQNDLEGAQEAIDKALQAEPENGDFIDSKAEFYLKQGKDSLAVVYLRKALAAPIKIQVSKEKYKTDPRWDKIRNRPDFKKMMK